MVLVYLRPILDQLYCDLTQWCERFVETPRDYKAMRLIAQVAQYAYGLGGDVRLRSVCRNFGQAAEKWAEQIRAEVLEGKIYPDDVKEARSKQALFLGTGLLCLGAFKTMKGLLRISRR
eukprot:GHVN01104200.1.p2 GENE.GHVN01104200.1~~GHVN01104200.1.p2  ORF type:complete len:119 (+),score=11.23 GHVN01104200.1:2982-3338(+)